MRNHKIVFAAIILLPALLISCVSKNEPLIVGKWKCSFNDSIELRKKIFSENKNLKPEWLDTTEPDRKGTIIWEFNEDKTVRRALNSTHLNENFYGTYDYVDGDKFFKLTGKKIKLTTFCAIIELTNNRFKFLFNGDTVDLSKAE